MKSAFKNQWRSGLTLREQASTRDAARPLVSLSFLALSRLVIKHCCFLPSIASQRYLQTRHLFLFCLFCFPSYYNRNGFVSVLVVWMIRVCVFSPRTTRVCRVSVWNVPGEPGDHSHFKHTALRVCRQQFQTRVLNMLKHCTLWEAGGCLKTLRGTWTPMKRGERVSLKSNADAFRAVETRWNLIQSLTTIEALLVKCVPGNAEDHLHHLLDRKCK